MTKDLSTAFEAPAGKDGSKPTIIGQQDGREVTVRHMGGMTIIEDSPVDFEKFRIIVTASYDDLEEEARRKMVLETESRLGFKFPGGAPVVHGYAMGYEFEGEPAMELPEGWTLKTVPNDFRPDMPLTDIHDEQDRFRGRLDKHHDRMILHFWPRLVFNFDIVAHTPSKIVDLGIIDGIPTAREDGMKKYWMTSINSAQGPIIPCILHVHPGNWDFDGWCDFTRIGREYDAIKKGEEFIAQQTMKLFTGAAIETGLGHETTKMLGQKVVFGNKKPGNIFDHWDPEADEKIKQLRAILEENLPAIVGKDNSLVLKLFPTKEELTEWKENAPEYQPPAARGWQKPIWWLQDRLSGNKMEP